MTDDEQKAQPTASTTTESGSATSSDNSTNGDVKLEPVKRNPRSSARIAAVQALYQMDLAGTGVTEVIEEFTQARFPTATGDDPITGADTYFFAELLRGVVRRQRDLDPMINSKLAAGWRLGRIDSTLRAILRSAAFELVERTEVPARVVITEYLNISHAFFDGDEPRVVNGVLDRLSKENRASEFSNSKPSSRND